MNNSFEVGDKVEVKDFLEEIPNTEVTPAPENTPNPVVTPRNNPAPTPRGSVLGARKVRVGGTMSAAMRGAINSSLLLSLENSRKRSRMS